MMGLENLVPFTLAALAVITAPGVDTFYIITHSVSRGQMKGIFSAFGVCCGIFVHTSLAAFGLSAIIAASAMLYTIIKYAGAAYLIYLGIRTFAMPAPVGFTASGKAEETVSNWNVFQKGMLTNVLNPKPALFFFSFLPQFVKPGYTDAVFPFFLLGGLFFVMAFIWCLFLAIGASRISSFVRENERFQNMLRKLSGLIFIGLGIKVALEKR